MSGLTPARVPAVLVQRGDLEAWHLGRATARMVGAEGASPAVRLDVQVLARRGRGAERLAEAWETHAETMAARRVDGRDVYDLRFYARPREAPTGEGLGLVRSTRARPADVARGAHHGRVAVWTLHAPDGVDLLEVQGADEPAAWEALDARSATATRATA